MMFYTRSFGCVCIGFPSTKGWCVFFSPDGRLENSTFYIGPDSRERVKSKLRRRLVGHNWMRKILNPSTPRHLAAKIIDDVHELNDKVDAIFNDFEI